MANLYKEQLKIGIVPFGSMGRGIAAVAERRGHQLSAYQRPNEIDRPAGSRNIGNVVVTSSMKEAVEGVNILFIASPSPAYEELAGEALSYTRSDCIVVSTTKALHPDGRRMTQVLEDLDRTGTIRYRMAVMSGANLSSDMEKGDIMGTMMASYEPKLPEYLRDVLQNPRFEVQPEEDVVATELGGAFKGVIALYAGMLDKLGTAASTKAKYITDLANECREIAERQGAESVSFISYSWLADILLCTVDNQSRSHKAGERIIIEPKSTEKFLSGQLWLAEGVHTIKPALTLARSCNLNPDDTPTINLINGIVHQGVDPVKAINELMGRSPRRGFRKLKSARFHANRVLMRLGYTTQQLGRTFTRALSNG